MTKTTDKNKDITIVIKQLRETKLFQGDSALLLAAAFNRYISANFDGKPYGLLDKDDVNDKLLSDLSAEELRTEDIVKLNLFLERLPRDDRNRQFITVIGSLVSKAHLMRQDENYREMQEAIQIIVDVRLHAKGSNVLDEQAIIDIEAAIKKNRQLTSSYKETLASVIDISEVFTQGALQEELRLHEEIQYRLANEQYQLNSALKETEEYKSAAKELTKTANAFRLITTTQKAIEIVLSDLKSQNPVEEQDKKQVVLKGALQSTQRCLSWNTDKTRRMLQGYDVNPRSIEDLNRAQRTALEEIRSVSGTIRLQSLVKVSQHLTILNPDAGVMESNLNIESALVYQHLSQSSPEFNRLPKANSAGRAYQYSEEQMAQMNALLKSEKYQLTKNIVQTFDALSTVIDFLKEMKVNVERANYDEYELKQLGKDFSKKDTCKELDTLIEQMKATRNKAQSRLDKQNDPSTFDLKSILSDATSEIQKTSKVIQERAKAIPFYKKIIDILVRVVTVNQVTLNKPRMAKRFRNNAVNAISMAFPLKRPRLNAPGSDEDAERPNHKPR